MFDLTIFPLVIDSGRERHELPGLLVAAAPRKAARMRAQDHLLLYCRLVTLAGAGQPGADLSPAQQQEILNRLAETYFSFSGSVTAGLRAVTARLNEFLLNRNLKSAQGQQTIGLLNLAALHGSSLIVAHAGATHSFVLSKTEVQHFDDSAAARNASARGLGVSRQPVPHFYQASLEPGDLLVVCADPPSSWTSRSLANSPQLSFDHLRRRLLNDSGDSLHATVVRFQPGKGQVTYWRPSESAHARPSVTRPVPPAPVPIDNQLQPVAPVEQTPSLAEEAAPATAEPPAFEAQPEITETIEERPAVEEEAIQQPDAEPGLTFTPSSAEPSAETPGIYLGADPSLQDSLTRTEPRPRPPRPDLAGQETEPAVQQPEPALQRSEPVAQRSELSVHRTVPHALETASETVRSESAAQAVHPAAQPDFQGGAAPRRSAGRSANHARAQERLRQETSASPPVSETIRRSLAAVWQRGSAARARADTALKKSAHMLPKRRDAEGREQPFFNISSSVMLAMALIVPLVVVTISLIVYDRIGRSEHFEMLLAQVVQYSEQASQQTDPALRRESWTQVYEQVSILERNYGKNDTSIALRRQALGVLDELEGFVRLSYQPAIQNGFPVGVNITRMVATLNDVYLLDSSEGRILRMYRTASGFEVDAKFSCGPGKEGAAVVGPLVDLAPLPPNNEMRSTIMGIDAGGSLAYCSPSMTGFDSRPLALPDAGWQGVTGMYLSGDTLFVLDPKGNAVYYYDGTNGVFADPPHFYFGATIPQLDNVVDIAADQEFLYLLHTDGRMTLCESGGFAFSDTSCTEPAPYGDSRPGYDPAPLSFPGARFTQLVTTQPPDPSLYLLDEANKSIYHLSLRRLNLQRQYRPVPESDFPLPNGTPTSFAVAPNRRVLLAFGNQVFFATLP